MPPELGGAPVHALIAGKKKFTDPEFVKTWDVMGKWANYLPKGYQAQTYGDSQNLFAAGKANSAEVIASITTTMEQLAWHRENAARAAQPELELEAGE